MKMKLIWQARVKYDDISRQNDVIHLKQSAMLDFKIVQKCQKIPKFDSRSARALSPPPPFLAENG